MSGSRIKYAYDTAPEKIAATHGFKLHQLSVHLSEIAYKTVARWQSFNFDEKVNVQTCEQTYYKQENKNTFTAAGVLYSSTVILCNKVTC